MHAIFPATSTSKPFPHIYTASRRIKRPSFAFTNHPFNSLHQSKVPHLLILVFFSILSFSGAYGAATPGYSSCLPSPPLNWYTPPAPTVAGVPCVGLATCSACSLSKDSPTTAYCDQLMGGQRTTSWAFGMDCAAHARPASSSPASGRAP